MYKNFPNITTANALDNYKIFLSFDDGVSGKVDLLDLKGKSVFSFWNDENNFKNFEISDNAMIWKENLDMDTNSFYLKIINKTFEEYARD